MIAWLFLPPVLGLAVLLWTLARLQRQGTKDPHGKIAQLHHGYLGFGLCVLSVFAMSVNVLGVEITGAIAYVFGLWWIGDDAYQHWRQHAQPFYRSAWHDWAAGVGIIK